MSDKYLYFLHALLNSLLKYVNIFLEFLERKKKNNQTNKHSFGIEDCLNRNIFFYYFRIYLFEEHQFGQTTNVSKEEKKRFAFLLKKI